MDMAHVYGTNTIKCYSQSLQTNTNEVRACFPYLRAEIEICQPRVILAMGTIPFLALKMLNRDLEEVEYQPGKVMKLRPDLHLLITCDLDAILSEESSKRRFWKDLQVAKSIIDKERAREKSS
jgi:DNA polymerase